MEMKEATTPKKQFISRNVTMILVYGRPPLVFAGMLCAIAVMLTQNPVWYTLGVVCLFAAMSFDLVDGWFAARFHPQAKLSHLADRIMDKIVYSIIFPLVALGMMWRFHFIAPENDRPAFLHVIFVLILCITVMVRDNFAHFMRNFALRKGEDEELKEITRLRTIVAAPVAALLYAHAFYVPEGPPSALYFWISWLGNIPLRVLFFIEILFLIINFGSIALYTRKYGSYCLDELCLGDEVLRRRILSLFPNALTVMNALMGILAIFFAYQGRLLEAYLILLGAAMFDKLDGAVARKLGLTEPLPDAQEHQFTFGGILDDISDGVSFCLAPAAIFYIALSQVENAVVQSLPYPWIALLYAVLGIARLTYFTLDRHPIPGFFKGMPVPGAALWVTAPLIMLSTAFNKHPEQVAFWGIFCFGVMVAGAILMNIYPIRYIHLGRMMGRHPWFFRGTLLVILLFVFTPYFGHLAFFYLTLYALSPLLTWRISPEVAEQETVNKPITSH